MQLIGMGLARIVTNASPIPSMPESMEWLGRGFIGGSKFGIPISVVIMVLMYILFAFIARRTRLGRNIYAIGGSAEAAYFAGINVKLNQMLVFTMGGGIAAFGGLILLSRLDSASVTNGYLYEFDAIIASVIGGISLSGGKGKVIQALFGAIFLTLFFNGMTMLNVHPFIQSVLKGAVLIGAVAIDVLRNRRR
jgi:ribose transport system permease protein